jgi:hypothetical protein
MWRRREFGKCKCGMLRTSLQDHKKWYQQQQHKCFPFENERKIKFMSFPTSPLISQNVKTTCKIEGIFFRKREKKMQAGVWGKIKTNYCSWKSHTLAQDKHFFFGWCLHGKPIYLWPIHVTSNGKLLRVFSVTFPLRVRFCGYKSFSVKGIEICLKLMLYWMISRDMSLRRIAIRWPSFISYVVCVWLCLLAFFHLCKWTETIKISQRWQFMCYCARLICDPEDINDCFRVLECPNRPLATFLSLTIILNLYKYFLFITWWWLSNSSMTRMGR